MSETIIQTAVLVFAAGIVGFALGCLFVRILAAGKQTTDTPQPKADAAPVVSAPPKVEPQGSAGQAGVAPAAGSGEPRQPQSLGQPRQPRADDLKQIKGIGPKLEEILNELGIFHFDQIADWTPDNIAWIDEHLAFHGRIEREDWISQAAALANSGGSGTA